MIMSIPNSSDPEQRLMLFTAANMTADQCDIACARKCFLLS